MYDFDGSNESLQNLNGLAAGTDNDETSGSFVFEADSGTLNSIFTTATGFTGAANTAGVTVYIGSPTGAGDFAINFFADWTTANGNWRTDDDFDYGDTIFYAWTYDKGATGNNPKIWISVNGGAVTTYEVGTNLTETTTPAGSNISNLDSVRIGETGGGTLDFNGRVGRVALWSDGHSDARGEALAGEVDPMTFQSGLIHYWPLEADLLDDVGSATLTANGTPTVSTAAPTFYPPRYYHHRMLAQWSH